MTRRDVDERIPNQLVEGEEAVIPYWNPAILKTGDRIPFRRE
jgi:hypothetical protein